MERISEDTAWKTDPVLPGITYEAACKPHIQEINKVAQEIFENLTGLDINIWAKVEIANKVKLKVEQTLGTIVDPGKVDVEAEEKRLDELLWKIHEYECIEREFQEIINSVGYRFRIYSEDEIWKIIEKSEHYW